MQTQTNFKEPAASLAAYTVALRRELHQRPEPASKEYETAARIRKELDAIGISYEIVAETGTLATITGGKPGKTVALRADIDALELDDEKNVPYRSQNPGLCHACGHDGHTAMLLTAAKLLHNVRDELHGTVKLIFQPAEEDISGARAILASSDFIKSVDSVFGIHLMATNEVGTICYCNGAFAASADGVRIRVTGLGGHGAAPHLAIDSGLVASAIVMDVQSLVSREISPSATGVVTFGVIHSGSRYNIIPESALLEGTIRSYDPEVRKVLCSGVERVAQNIAAAYRAKAEIEFFSSVRPLINNKERMQGFLRTAESLVGAENVVEVPPLTGSDDFAEYLAAAPGIYVAVGCRNEKKGITHYHHHPLFDIDEDSLLIGSALYAQYAYDFLNN